MYTVTLARKPLDQSTAASNVLEHGCGAVAINASRVRSALLPSERRTSQPGGGSVGGIYGAMAGYVQVGERHNADGRFPANLMLRHQTGCECAGSKRVSTGRAINEHRAASKTKQVYGDYTKMQGENVGYGDADGKEAVDAWNCESDCPVSDLDEQSLAGGVHGAGVDTGGASRFFKQVK